MLNMVAGLSVFASLNYRFLFSAVVSLLMIRNAKREGRAIFKKNVREKWCCNVMIAVNI